MSRNEFTNSKADIDFSFIHRLEGGSLTRGYVPDVRNSKSGVTIGAGFDLGARNASDLEKLGLDSNLIAKLYPYLGLQRHDAANYLRQHPLEISQEQAAFIDVKVKQRVIDGLIRKYDQMSPVEFCSIPGCWQTVIASVEFQYGSVKTKCPTFWRLVTGQSWSEALHELRNFGDRYATRRNQEADFVESSMR
ncbi:pesticin C-terminus-like muramidase [Glaciecola sp.]|jgi:hypothetical protein|uniref:pesticin C-terminus-like muramidase n=1 Tax=Glaciecola sp. MF2-115 TaxID=3384827 RepID=UPI0039892AC5